MRHIINSLFDPTLHVIVALVFMFSNAENIRTKPTAWKENFQRNFTQQLVNFYVGDKR